MERKAGCSLLVPRCCLSHKIHSDALLICASRRRKQLRMTLKVLEFRHLARSDYFSRAVGHGHCSTTPCDPAGEGTSVVGFIPLRASCTERTALAFDPRNSPKEFPRPEEFTEEMSTVTKRTPGPQDMPAFSLLEAGS